MAQGTTAASMSRQRRISRSALASSVGCGIEVALKSLTLGGLCDRCQGLVLASAHRASVRPLDVAQRLTDGESSNRRAPGVFPGENRGKCARLCGYAVTDRVHRRSEPDRRAVLGRSPPVEPHAEARSARGAKWMVSTAAAAELPSRPSLDPSFAVLLLVHAVAYRYQ